MRGKLAMILFSSALSFTLSCKKEAPCANCSVNNNLPVAKAGHDQFISLPTNFVLLDGSNSISDRVAIKEFNWKKIQGPVPHTMENPSNPKTYVRNLKEGVYYFQLSVTDMAGAMSKDTIMVMVNPTDFSVNCSNREIKYATLIPFGKLSIARFGVVGASAGSKLLFAAGWTPGAHSSRVDIYDTISKSWATAELTIPERDGMAIATVGNKILFAGGGNNDWIDVTSRVDIYDAATNSWSTAELSQARNYPAAVTLNNKVYIAGGGYWGPLTTGSNTNYHIGSATIDIYDNSNNTWSTSKLKDGRFELSATAINNKIYFAGGLHSNYSASDQVDIFDVVTGNWSYSKMQSPRTAHVGVPVGDKIMWAGGASTPYNSGYHLTDNLEVRDINSGISSFECFLPKSHFRWIKISDQIIFYSGLSREHHYMFDVYNISDQKWTTVLLPINLRGSAILEVNNNLYIAGGSLDGVYTDQVWKLEF